MGSTNDVTQITSLLKVRYSDKRIRMQGYDKQPFLGMVPKDTSGSGLNFTQAVHYGASSTRANNLADAQAAATNAGSAGNFASFVVPYVEEYATANYSGAALDRSRNDAGAFVNVVTQANDLAIKSISRSLGKSLFRNGGGALGQISSGSTVGSTTITLSNTSDITNFEVGMCLQVASTDGTSGAVRSGVVFIKALSRSAGTITVSSTLGGAAANWTATIAAAAAGDYIFQYGDFGKMAFGVGAWVPASDPTSTLFCGVDRSVDATRLGGLRFNGNGAPYEETLIDALSLCSRESCSPDAGFMNPADIAILSKALSGKVLYERMGSSKDEPSIGFSGVKLSGPEGVVEIYPDVNVPKGTVFLLTMSTWKLISMGNAPKIINQDGLTVRPKASSDDWETRYVARHLLVCSDPGLNCNVTL
jgi:hypothetical protein